MRYVLYGYNDFSILPSLFLSVCELMELHVLCGSRHGSLYLFAQDVLLLRQQQQQKNTTAFETCARHQSVPDSIAIVVRLSHFQGQKLQKQQLRLYSAIINLTPQSSTNSKTTVYKNYTLQQ